MKLVCPKNPEHKLFTVTAHVTQIWEVDEDNNFIDSVQDCVDVTHKPDENDYYVCAYCSAEATVIKEA